ncbi:Multiple C2 and transmembrane domain-containing protein 2 [Dermatophagoides farinae]|nr:Multiple C2 and transmembrane domain-containing protein 2 [Dermatophagoides farinae]
MSRLKRIKRDMHRICLQRNQQQKFRGTDYVVQSDDSCHSEKSFISTKQNYQQLTNNSSSLDENNNDNNNNNSIESIKNNEMAPIAIMDEQQNEPIMMAIDNQQQQQQQQIKPKIRILKTKASKTIDLNKNDDSSDEMSTATITDTNVNGRLSEMEDMMRLQRIHRLLQYPFFQIDCHLKHGENLLAKDSCGTSDPYVKFMLGNRVVYKSQTKYKTLNPIWDEYFVLPVDNICEPMTLKVFDYDLFFMDDYLGTANIDLTKLEPGISTDFELYLHDNNNNANNNMQNYDSSWGKIVLTIRLNPKTHEEREYYYGRGKWTTIAGMDGQTNKRIKSQLYDSIVSIVLIKGDNIDLDHDYCIRMKLGMEKYKSKTAVKSVRSPYWAEQFDLHLYADQSKVLEITLGYSGQQHHHQQNNDFIDKVCTDLSELEPEHTHRFVYEFNTNPMMVNRNSMTTLSITSAACNSSNNNSFNKSTTMMMARIEMLVTITGLQSSSTTKQQQQETYDMIQIQQQQQQQQQPNSLKQLISLAKLKDLNNFYENFLDIGTLIVKVHRAENLAAADINGKSDPFCVLELVNERLRTSTEYKTLSPVWNKLFKFKIKDIHDVLEVTVYDEDKDRVEFLGKVALPLLKIKNGEKHWYALKDKKLRHRSKGHIFLECWITYNQLKASVLTFTPRPTKYVQNEIKFKRTLFIRNAMRLKNICLEFVEIGQFLHSCIQWESPTRSIFAFITFLASVYYFEFYMIPLVILLYILMNYIGIRFHNYSTRKVGHNQNCINNSNNNNDDYYNDDEYIDETKLIDEDFDEKGEEKKSFKEKLQTVQDLSTLVMLIIGQIASYIERCKNATNFTVPYLTWLAVICMSMATIVLYFIHIRYLILLWGINKFTKKFRSPDSINNNEIIDFLSRVPDMEEKIMYKQFKPTINRIPDDGGTIQQQQQQQPQGQGSIPINQNQNTHSIATTTTTTNRSSLI